MTPNSDSTYKYAIYGGSFDPLHIGHLSLADCAVRECGLDELIFMPAHVSPFKQGRDVADGIDRISMIRSILCYNNAFRVSDYELNKEGPSYTIETLRHFSKERTGNLYFILGFDSLVQLDKWYLGDEIISDYHLITSRRPDTDDREGMLTIERFRKQYRADITVLSMKPIDASSTDIRNNIKRGIPITNMVPPEIEDYIIEHNLYR